MPIEFWKVIRRSDLKAHPDFLFVFGDNLERTGFGGQAKEMRGEPNALGVPTKKRPRTDEGAYFTDAEYEENVRILEEAFLEIFWALEFDNTVIFPEAGLGTGRAELPTRAPKTYAYIREWIDGLRDIFSS